MKLIEFVMVVVLSVAKCALFSMVKPSLCAWCLFADNEEGLNYQIGEPEYPAPESLRSEAELKKMMVEFVPEKCACKFHAGSSCGNSSNRSDTTRINRSLKHLCMRTDIRTHDRIAAESG